MHICLIEPYFTGSHKKWSLELQQYSSHRIELLTLPGRYWKWRMHGAAVTLAEKFNDTRERPDLIITSDMVDLTTFLSLTREKSRGIPVIIYFHENQLTYPWNENDKDLINRRDHHYGFINYASALCADAVVFNSRYHLKSFTGALTPFLRQFPDFKNMDTIQTIKEKCHVLPLGIDLRRLDAYKAHKKSSGGPLLLWNHRWEYDKNPKDFFDAVYHCMDSGLDFNVAVLGEHFSAVPEEFVTARKRLGSRAVHFGYATSIKEYARLLWQADILPVTSNQDFFGISIMEAVYCNTIPLLPRRLTYPELFSRDFCGSFFYEDDNLSERLASMVRSYRDFDRSMFHDLAGEYDWSNIILKYDNFFEKVFAGQ